MFLDDDGIKETVASGCLVPGSITVFFIISLPSGPHLHNVHALTVNFLLSSFASLCRVSGLGRGH
ncbi:hypothetical protein F5J12DRAFT_526741 [Pisolithus orientalis]|uniref:uncharacterized protein n=1 Tax=Pisolithus orientalis TaxID=936130 RepID=UPI00222590D1|nr:uncharacterized protein F5J12DRAFT_526741 [Pisolithus orientalis]KAI6015325.1 hypothetical protein F5J12DRAFT_526741 [Pisolithus orientalis]